MPMLQGFIGGAYEAESVSENAQRCLNFYLEQDATGKGQNVLYGTPGLRLLATLGIGPVRASLLAGDSLIVVSGNGLYRLRADYSSTLLLTLNTASGPAFIAQAGTNALVTDGKNGYFVDFSMTAWTAGIVTSLDFPAMPGSCTAMDGYFITHSLGLNQYQISAPFDAQTWDAADTGSKEGHNDPITRIIALYRELIVMGSETTEVHQDTGDTNFPFVRIDGAFIEQGTISPLSVADIDGALLWLGASKVGRGIVWRMQGFTPTRVSTHAIEQAISTYAVIEDAVGWSYQEKGHAFYVLSFPTAQRTWCYDITTTVWHQRPYLSPITGQLEAHRAVNHSEFNGTHVVGDRVNGNLYALDRNVYSDNGSPLLSLRASPHVFNAGLRAFLAELEFFLQPGVGLTTGQGSDPKAMLRMSKDGGQSFAYQRFASIGKQGETRARCRFQRLMNARDMVIEFSITDPVKRVLIGANARIG